MYIHDESRVRDYITNDYVYIDINELYIGRAPWSGGSARAQRLSEPGLNIANRNYLFGEVSKKDWKIAEA